VSDDEEVLRRGLRDLAELDGPPGGLTAVETFLAKGRRARHRRRRSLAVCGAVVLVAGGSALGVRWTETDTGPVPNPPPLASKGPHLSRGTYEPQPPSEAGGPLDTGPAKPSTGTRYRYDLSAVCDLKYAVFGGRVWERSEGRTQFTFSWASDRLHGYMRWSDGQRTRAEVDTATFETDSPATPVLTYHPLSGEAPPCLAQEPERRFSDAPAATLGPKDPHIGTRYVYDMTKDCDMRYAEFGGRLWRAEGPGAPASMISFVDGLPVPAHMTLVSKDTALLELPGPPKTTKIAYHLVERRADDCPKPATD
jgi:hypothetical protein